MTHLFQNYSVKNTKKILTINILHNVIYKQRHSNLYRQPFFSKLRSRSDFRGEMSRGRNVFLPVQSDGLNSVNWKTQTYHAT